MTAGPQTALFVGPSSELAGLELPIAVQVPAGIGVTVPLLPDAPTGYAWVTKNLQAIAPTLAGITTQVREVVSGDVRAQWVVGGGPDINICAAGVQTTLAVEIHTLLGANTYAISGSAVLVPVAQCTPYRMVAPAAFTTLFPPVPAGKVLVPAAHPTGIVTGSAAPGAEIAWLQNIVAVTVTVRWRFMRGGIQVFPVPPITGVGWVVAAGSRIAAIGTNGAFALPSLQTGDEIEIRDDGLVTDRAIVGGAYKLVDLFV